MKPNEYVVHGSLPLPPGSILSIADGREMVVHVQRGNVWITQERDPRDAMLKAGERFCITRRGRTLIQALGGSLIALTSPYERCCARHIELVAPGAAVPLLVYEAEGGWRGAIAALTTSLMKTWVGLYAPPGRRMGAAL